MHTQLPADFEERFGELYRSAQAEVLASRATRGPNRVPERRRGADVTNVRRKAMADRRREDIAYFLTEHPDGSARDFDSWIVGFATTADWEPTGWGGYCWSCGGDCRVPYPHGLRAIRKDMAALRTVPPKGGARR